MLFEQLIVLKSLYKYLKVSKVEFLREWVCFRLGQLLHVLDLKYDILFYIYFYTFNLGTGHLYVEWIS